MWLVSARTLKIMNSKLSKEPKDKKMRLDNEAAPLAKNALATHATDALETTALYQQVHAYWQIGQAIVEHEQASAPIMARISSNRWRLK